MDAIKKRVLPSREEEAAPELTMSISILAGYPEMGTPEQAAEVLQIGLTTCRQMCRDGRLPAAKIGNQWRIPRAWLIEFLADSSSDN